MIAAFSQCLVFSVDFVMCVFLWLVQLIIYPSFSVIDLSKLNSWHLKYTKRVGLIMGPIMILQIFLVGSVAYYEPNGITIFRLIVLLSCWVLTVLISVPLHRKIENRVDVTQSIEALVKTNWSRTALWTILYLSNFA
jgi:hypothetical protein